MTDRLPDSNPRRNPQADQQNPAGAGRASVPPPGYRDSAAARRSEARADGRVKVYNRPSRAKTLARVTVAAGCAFLAILGGLSLQMASGKDPALGPKAQALAATRAQKPHKKIIRRTVVVRKVYPEEESSPSGDDGAYNSGYGSGSSAAPAAPTQSYSAPAPAPAPAPVTTSTS